MSRFAEPWFPLSRELMENTPPFTSMPITHRLFFWEAINSFNLSRGPFRKRDCDFARRLSLSLPTIRRARKEIASQGWIELRGREYTCVKQPGIDNMLRPAQRSKQFARVSREAFDRLLEGVREGVLRHEDVGTYVYLCCWRWYRGWAKGPDFCIPKGKLAGLVGIDNPTSSIRRLEEFPFFSAPPFECSEKGDVLNVTNFKTYVGIEGNPVNLKQK